MSITRKMLAAMGLEAEKIDEIIEGHTATVNGLKDEIEKAKAENDRLKVEADKAVNLQTQLDELNKQIQAEAKKREGKDYDALKKEFDDYKLSIQQKEIHGKKEGAYRKLLNDAGIPEKFHDRILKYSDVDGVDLDDKEEIKNAKDIMKSVKEDWAELVPVTTTTGAPTVTPPGNSNNGGGKMTVEQIDAIKDTKERQRAMLENHELFGF